MKTAAEIGPWTFSWTAVAALATAVLALFTAALAFSTRRLARETGQDVRSAWRPVVIGAATGPKGTAELIVEPRPVPETALLQLFISNVGTGPALNLKIAPSSFGAAPNRATAVVERGTVGPHTTNPHQQTDFEGQGLPAVNNGQEFGYKFLLTYEDVSGTTYQTLLTYDKPVDLSPTGEPFDHEVRLRLGHIGFPKQ